MLRTRNVQPSLWESILPEVCLRLPAELARVDGWLDDDRFFAPFPSSIERQVPAAVTLDDGSVLVTGGYNDQTKVTSSAILVPPNADFHRLYFESRGLPPAVQSGQCRLGSSDTVAANAA